MFGCAGGLLLAVAAPVHRVTAAHSLLPGSHAFWLGLAIGLGVSVVPVIPWWIRVVSLAVALLAAGVVRMTNSHGHAHMSPSVTPWVVVALAGLGLGLYFGRVRGLRHLGEADFRTRSRAIRTISRF